MSAGKETRKAKELFEMKMKAIEYYEQNGVPQKMEEILNNMFFDNPNDVYGHVVSIDMAFNDPPGMIHISISNESIMLYCSCIS